MLLPFLFVLGSSKAALPASGGHGAHAHTQQQRNELRRNEVRAAPPSLSDVTPEVGVPFACGRVYTVSQGHDVGSHLHNDTFAWDFRMPEGTPIVAARDGVVRMARGDSRVGGCDMKYAPMANYVVVDHGDGLETQYLHFSAVTVRVGESVKQGQLLGFSGNTGWSCGAHLHFKVAKRAGPGWNNPSVPARITGYGDPTRDTDIAAPACSKDDAPLMAQGGAGGDERMNAASAPAVDERAQAVGGVPAGAKAVVEGFEKPASQRGQPRVEAGKAAAAGTGSSPAQARAGE